MCTSMLSSSIYRKHSTVQSNQPCTKQQSKYMPIRARKRKQASFLVNSFLGEDPSFSLLFVFVDLFFLIRACYRRASSASTAQHSAINPHKIRQASTCRSECDNASKQTELATASTRRRAFIQHAECSKRTK